jgi:hypothetical protein
VWEGEVICAVATKRSFGAPVRPLPPAGGKSFTIEAERRLKECEERLEPFTERVDGYRGKS